MQFYPDNTAAATLAPLRAALDAGALQELEADALLVYSAILATKSGDAAFVEMADVVTHLNGLEPAEVGLALDELLDANLAVRETDADGRERVALIDDAALIDPARFNPQSLIRGDQRAEDELAALVERLVAEGEARESAEARAAAAVARWQVERERRHTAAMAAAAREQREAEEAGWPGYDQAVEAIVGCGLWSQLAGAQAAVWTVLASHADEAGLVKLSKAQIAREAGVTTRTVRRAIGGPGGLIARGPVILKRSSPGGSAGPSVYRMRHPSKAPQGGEEGGPAHG